MAEEREHVLLLSTPPVPSSVELTTTHGTFVPSLPPSTTSASHPSSPSTFLPSWFRPLRLAQACCAGTAMLMLVMILIPDQVCDVLDIGCAPHDFIIVGAGPAGSAIAYHLGAQEVGPDKSTSTAPRVLVLEAGGPSQHATGGDDYLYSNLTVFDVPLAWSYVAHLQQYHWHVPGDAILAKAVGGCGVHNAMLYVRAMPQNVESWNMSEWRWEDIYEQYLRLENYDGSPVFAEYHGSGGAMATSPPIFEDLLGQKFLETTQLLGIRQSGDFNAPLGRVGAGYYHFNIRHGVRDGAAATLLTPTILRYPDRVILREFTTVDKLNLVDAIDSTGALVKRVDSLELSNREGEAWNQPVAMGTSVVLTAGAVNTPALLMRSGIGNREDMQDAGLGKPIVELPVVGRRIQDHPAVGLVFQVNPPLVADIVAEYKHFSNWTEGRKLERYPLSFGYPGFSTGAFLHSGLKDPDDSSSRQELPDLQLTVFPLMIEPHISKRYLEITYNRVLVTVAVVNPRTEYTVRMSPKKGRRRLDKHSPCAHSEGKCDDGTDDDYDDDFDDSTPGSGPSQPELYHDHLDELDVARLVRGAHIVREIFASDPLKTLVVGEVEPGKHIDTDETLAEWALESHNSNSHWCCSAGMGKNKATGAVDGDLKIFGVQNLYVGDASVLPSIPNGNVHSTVVAVASVWARRMAARFTGESR